jgi:hypothetical protein
MIPWTWLDLIGKGSITLPKTLAKHHWWTKKKKTLLMHSVRVSKVQFLMRRLKEYEIERNHKTQAFCKYSVNALVFDPFPFWLSSNSLSFLLQCPLRSPSLLGSITRRPRSKPSCLSPSRNLIWPKILSLNQSTNH